MPVGVGKEIDRLIRAGAIRPAIGEVLPLERGADAFRLLAERKAVGKVILRWRDPPPKILCNLGRSGTS